MRLCVKDFTTDFTDFTDGELIRAARVASVKSVNPWLPFVRIPGNTLLGKMLRPSRQLPETEKCFAMILAQTEMPRDYVPPVS